jgi:Ca2+-binding RTX toxin-like protein
MRDRTGTPADESADDVQNANNTDSPWVDQSQTYTSHASHQVFLREYVDNTAGRPVSTGRLLGGLAPNQSGMATWASVKAQAATLLGLKLTDVDVTNIPMLATDPYGKFIPGPARGLPQYVTATGLVEGNRTGGGVPVPANVRHFDTPFLTDIAHNADPGTVGPCATQASGSPAGCLSPDTDTTASADFANQPTNTYDDEMLNAHFCAGDGRVNENIALTTVHQIFHSEHDRLVEEFKTTLTNAGDATALAEWKSTTGAAGWNGERLFQAARFVTEMEYQHLVFEEFARKVQPGVRPFHIYSPDINPAIPAEFAHAVYRFGHSMLDDEVARKNIDGSDNSLPLLKAFLNPPEYFRGGSAGALNPDQAAGSVVMGSVDQTGNELDEFVTETLRNNLLGLPLDLPTLNMARARDAGVPPLNQVRRDIFGQTNDGQLAPYTSWSDFGQHLKHPESLINFVAAYGQHDTITGATTLAGKRAAARAIVDPLATDTRPADAADFMFSSGTWATRATGLDDVDLWVGGLAEVTSINGGLLGTTFNYVFQTTLENLQDGDRLYYLNRTPGMNLRTQLEGNSFAELIQRNTDGTNTLKADVFSTADCKFQLANLAGTAAGFSTPVPGHDGSFVADDLTTPDCDESLLLTRSPDGTISYKLTNTVDPSGINGQAVYNGTPGVDRIKGGIDNDTFWGGTSNDVIDGNSGDDVALGGDGNDVLTDLNGADVLKGGPGNDAIDTGVGDDISMGGDGQDFINGGQNDNEHFGGEGDDFIIAGAGADAVFGDGGDDWIEGGSGQDLLQGDHAAPFFDDPAETKPGNDLFIGQVGENDYDAEGGDDVMAQNAAVDRNAGAAGFDWAFHQYDTVGADDDMNINANLAGLPLPIVVNRDRWQETEANSGSAFADVIRGDDFVPFQQGSTVAGVGIAGGFTGCDALDSAGLARVTGLAAIVPLDTGTNAQDPGAAGVGHVRGLTCPLSGAFWGAGNILLGGTGSDTIEGRGADDIIDGDRSMSVKINVQTSPTNTTLLGSTDLMEHQYLRDSTGALTGPTLQANVFAGIVDAGSLRAARQIDTPPANTDVDTAVYGGPRSSYTITLSPTAAQPSRVIVNQTVAPVAPQKVSDGIDTLYNIEKLQFTDQTLTIAPSGTFSPASLTFASQQSGTTSATPQTITISNGGLQPLQIRGIAFTGDFARATVGGGGTCTTTTDLGAPGSATNSCTVRVVFSPTGAVPPAARSGSLVITDNNGGAAGSTQSVPLSGTATAAPVIATTTAGSTAFGNQTVLVTSAGRTTATVTNQLATSINLAITNVGGQTTEFVRTAPATGTNCGTTLAAGASCNIAHTFRPAAGGARTTGVRVTSTASGVTGSNVQTVTLTGTGVNGGIGLTSPNLVGGTLQFGARPQNRLLGIALGTWPATTRTLTVSSTGPGALVVASITDAGANAGRYAESTNCGTAPRAAAGATCTITVTFTANAVGAQNATLVINTNAVATPTLVPMTGAGGA